MPFRPRNVQRLGSGIKVTIPEDEEGHIGRECPNADCEAYFKIKPGTGLDGEDLPFHCAYCGHTGSPDEFFTQEQIEYATSVAMRELDGAVRADLKQLEFEHKPSGAFGIGISMKLEPGTPPPIHHYREQKLETDVTCDVCSLEYAVFGVFGFCPDCGAHNSLTILESNLTLIEKQLNLASSLEDPDLRTHLVEDALENCVSAFDGFAREVCRVRREKSSSPAETEHMSFQSLPRASVALEKLFKVRIADAIADGDWQGAHLAFMKRHLIAHKSGVVDQRFLDDTGQPAHLLGKRVRVEPDEVRKLAGTVRTMGSVLVDLLPPP